MGEYFKECEKFFSENPKKIDKIPSIKQIYAGFNSFFALSEAKGIFGWGDNTNGQVSSIGSRGTIYSPQPLKINIGNYENIHVISGNSTTFLLSSQKAELTEAESSKEKGEGKGSAICGT